jgi:hypothetical protein
MKKLLLSLLALSLGGTAVLSTSLRAEAAPGAAPEGDAHVTEAYRGYLAAPSYRLPNSISSAITLRIEQFSTPEETAEITALLARGHTGAVQSWLGERALGTLQIGDALAEPIGAAWSYSDENGRHLVVVAPRAVSIREIFGPRLRAIYPYTVAQFDLLPNGSGSGEFSFATRLRVDRGGHLGYDPLAVLPVRILGVRPLRG